MKITKNTKIVHNIEKKLSKDECKLFSKKVLVEFMSKRIFEEFVSSGKFELGKQYFMATKETEEKDWYNIKFILVEVEDINHEN